MEDDVEDGELESEGEIPGMNEKGDVKSDYDSAEEIIKKNLKAKSKYL